MAAAAAAFLQEVKQLPDALRDKGKVLQELEDAMRAKGDVTREEEALLKTCRFVANAGQTITSAACGLVGWFVLGGNKWTGRSPLQPPLLLRFGWSAGSALFFGKVMYYWNSHSCTKRVFDLGEERMKMKLANIILTKHSDDKTLVEAVKRHFFAEHLFNDQHQGRPVFRWRPRHSYIDSAFMERVKEIEANNSYDKARSIEANNSYDKARSISAHTAISFGDLMEDPLACILGSPGGDMESSKPLEHTGTSLKRRELRAHRRSHRHHHRHADKFAAL